MAELVGRGGPAARALKVQRDKVKDNIRECVLRGSQEPVSAAKGSSEGAWEREAAVMVGSVLGALNLEMMQMRGQERCKIHHIYIAIMGLVLDEMYHAASIRTLSYAYTSQDIFPHVK